MNEQLKYQIAITLIPGVGPVLARNLISYCGGVEAVFNEKEKNLLKIPVIGPVTAKAILKHTVFERAEQECMFISKHKIETLFFLDADYPQRLRNCTDAPLILYFKGDVDFNQPRVIAIVGTRNASEYGKETCEQLINDLSAMDIMVVSGLAYGIDICAHKAALKNNIATVGVLAHGLDRIYPGTHKSVADKMLDKGGLLTEYISETNPDKENFPSRNRIVAGISDAVIVVEAAHRGGALITAEIANNYNRDVFAFPGRVNDIYSQGCNRLIKTNKAALIESAADLVYILGWDIEKQKAKTTPQRKLFIELTPDENVIIQLLNESTQLDVDTISSMSKMPLSKISMALLNLEFSGILKSLPGKRYQLI